MPKTSAGPRPSSGPSSSCTQTECGNTPKRTSSAACRACSSTKSCTAEIGKRRSGPPPPASRFRSGLRRACTVLSPSSGQRKPRCTYGTSLAAGSWSMRTAPRVKKPAGSAMGSGNTLPMCLVRPSSPMLCTWSGFRATSRKAFSMPPAWTWLCCWRRRAATTSTLPGQPKNFRR